MAHVADAGAGLMRFVFAEDADRAEAGAEQAGQNAQQRGFARAVFAEQNVAAARLEIDRDLAQRGKGAEELGDLSRRAQTVDGCGTIGGRRRKQSCGQLAGGCTGADAAAAQSCWQVVLARLLAGLRGRVFAGALGLQHGGVEDAVAAIGAFGQGLRVVFEGVGRRLGAFVD